MTWLLDLFRPPRPSQLDRIETALQRIGETMATITEALTALTQNVSDVKAGVDAIIARLNEPGEVDVPAVTAALEEASGALQAVEDNIAAALAEPPDEG